MVAEHAARALSPGAPLASSIHRGRINPAGPVPVSLAGTDGQASVAALFQVLYLERTGLAVEAQLEPVGQQRLWFDERDASQGGFGQYLRSSSTLPGCDYYPL